MPTKTKGKVSAYHKCFGKELKGKTFRTKTAQKKAIKAAINKCKKKVGSHKKTVRTPKKYRR